MNHVLTASEMRAFDEHLINNCGINSLVLMEQAAYAVSRRISELINNKLVNDSLPILILCGSGNNGGDGLAILRILRMWGYDARAIVLKGSKFSSDASTNFDIAMHLGFPCRIIEQYADLESSLSNNYSIIIDALLGTGLTRDIEGIFAYAIALSNQKTCFKLAVDIPSGVNSDSGAVCGCAFMADETITFQSFKRGQLLYPGREYCGEISTAPIGIPAPTYSYQSNEFIASDHDFECVIPKRQQDSHKGSCGRLLIIAGSPDYRGAAVVNAKAALRCGVGLVRVICPESICSAFSALPEAMLVPIPGDWDTLSCDILKNQLEFADAIAIGSGMGSNNNIVNIVNEVTASGKPCVVDADALNALAKEGSLPCGSHIILTPHIGEMGRLLSLSPKYISENAHDLAQSFVKRHNVNLVLKSATTIIANKDRLIYNTTGGPELAKGGSGDVLCGIIGSFLAQGMAAFDAAWAAPYLLGISSQRAIALLKDRMPIASDVISAIMH